MTVISLALVMAGLLIIIVTGCRAKKKRGPHPRISLYAGSSPLRRSPQRQIVGDVVMIAVGIGAFEYVFYCLGHRWQYESETEMQHAVATGYRAAVPTNAVTQCGGCVERVREQLSRITDTERQWILQQLQLAVDTVVDRKIRPAVDARVAAVKTERDRMVDSARTRVETERDRVVDAAQRERTAFYDEVRGFRREIATSRP